MESQRLSSTATIPWKYVFTPLWTAGFAFGTIALMVDGDPMRWLYLAITLLGLALFFYKFAKVRHVHLRNDRFYISDLGRHHEVPVSQLHRVEASRWINPQTVVLYFRNDTGFGKKVAFIARWSWMAGFEEHPVVDELHRLMRRRSQR